MTWNCVYLLLITQFVDRKFSEVNKNKAPEESQPYSNLKRQYLSRSICCRLKVIPIENQVWLCILNAMRCKYAISDLDKLQLLCMELHALEISIWQTRMRRLATTVRHWLRCAHTENVRRVSLPFASPIKSCKTRPHLCSFFLLCVRHEFIIWSHEKMHLCEVSAWAQNATTCAD